MPLVGDSLNQHSSWESEDGFDTTRYVADFRHPVTSEIHPMVTDISTTKDENGHFYPVISTQIFPKGYDVDKLGREMFDFENVEDDAASDNIAHLSISPARQINDIHHEYDPLNWGNARLVGTPFVRGAPDEIRGSVSDKLIADYKHRGFGTAMYDMAADVIHRHTRGGHKIYPDRIRTAMAKRMWAKHEARGYWPAKHQR